MIALLRFAIATEPFTWAFISLLAAYNALLTVRQESHWFAWVFLGLIYGTLLLGAARHRRTLAELAARQNKELIAFGNHVLRNRNKMTISPVSDADLIRFRQMQKGK